MVQEYQTNQANKTIGSNIGKVALLKLFDALVTPIVAYGAQVWFPFVEGNLGRHINITATFNKCLKGAYPHENMHINFCKLYSEYIKQQ